MILTANSIPSDGRRAMIHLKLIFLIMATTIGNGVLCLSPTIINAIVNVEKGESKTRTNTMSRRSCLTTRAKAAAGLLGGGVIFGFMRGPAFATDTLDTVKTDTTNPSKSKSESLLETNRNILLQLIRPAKKSSINVNEAEVLSAIENLVPFDPSVHKGATMKEDLDGEWELLWSAKAEAFSPLLKLPKPFKPDSFQYLGNAAAAEVGIDRVAQGLTGGILGQSQLWLSSGVRASSEDESMLEILPPFRFEVGGRYQSGKAKKRLVEAGSDAEFRKLNSRTAEAQAAPKNSYRQLYLERQGKGSLRISTITDGDPVIVGAIFVHRKL